MIEYKSNLDALIKDFDKLDGTLKNALKKGMSAGAWRFVGHIQKRQMTGRPGLIPHHSTAGLRGSWHASIIKDSGMDYGVKIATRSKYAAIHQFGGVIKAKGGGALAIPISPAAKRAASPRDFNDLVFINRPGHPPLLIRGHAGRKYGKDGARKGGRMEIMYVLKKSVRIPKRLHVLESFKSEGFQVIRRAMWQAIATEMKLRGMQGTGPNTSL